MTALAAEGLEDAGVELVSPLIERLTITAPANANAVAFANAGQHFAVALGDGCLAIGTLAAGTLATGTGGTRRDDRLEEPELVLPHRHAVAAVAVKAFGDGFVSAGQDGTLHFTHPAEPERGTCLWSSDGEWIEAVAVHEAAGRVAAARARSLVVLARDGATLLERRFEQTISALAFDRDGGRVAVSHYGGVSLVEIEGGAIEHCLEWKGAHIGVTWSPDNRYVVSATQEKELHIWDLVTMRDFRMGGYPRKTHQMAWTADGQMLACSGADVVTAWPFQGSGPERRPPVEIGFVFGAMVTAVAAHPRQNLVASGFSSGSVLVGGTVKGEALIARSRTASPVTGLAFSPDGRRLIGVDQAGCIVLFGLPEQLGVR